MIRVGGCPWLFGLLIFGAIFDQNLFLVNLPRSPFLGRSKTRLLLDDHCHPTDCGFVHGATGCGQRHDHLLGLLISHASVALLASLAWGDRKYRYFVIQLLTLGLLSFVSRIF